METFIFENSPTDKEIMEVFWQETFNPEQFNSLDEFLDWTKVSLWKFNGIGLDLGTNLSLDEKCKLVVSSLQKHNLINIEVKKRR